MAGSVVSVNQQDEAMAMNVIVMQWEVQYARFVQFPPLSTSHSSSSGESPAANAAHHPPLLPISQSSFQRKIRRGGVWISSVSSSTAGTASLKLIADCSADAVLNLSLRCNVLEEHRISQMNFTWPQVSCMSGFPARGARVVFVSYKNCFGQVQKFVLRFLTSFEAERFIDILKEILDAQDGLPDGELGSELSSQSEFFPSIGLPFRAEEDCRNTSTADTTDHGPESLSFEVDTHSIAQEAIQDREAEEILSDFPPSFTSFLKNCCPASEKVEASIPEEGDLKTQVVRYLEDSSFQDMLTKVEKIICEIGDGAIL